MTPSATSSSLPELTPALLLRLYAAGIFPMAESADDPTLFWLEPDPRGILPLERFHVSRKLQRLLRNTSLVIRIDTAFEAVVDGCAASASGRQTTWINGEIRRLTLDLHRIGHARSVECWDGEALVGGLYGVCLGGAFFGESMFSLKPEASKIALCHLVARLRLGGFRLLDTQFVTDHLARFGAVDISREAYRRRLAEAIAAPARFYEGPLPPEALAFRQSFSQTS